MPQLPFDIPKSLASYAEHFEDDPLKATTRLKKQLKKRGPDAVGHFLLAWFYHLKGMEEKAIEAALKARIYAPGSPFFEKLHYYLSHPRLFEAWTPDAHPLPGKRTSGTAPQLGPVLDLDALIQKLSDIESNRVPPPDTSELGKESKNKKTTDDVDDIVSETLANIHEKQGKMDAAIRTYKRLKELNEGKRDYYKKQIARLEHHKKKQDDS